MAGARHVTPGPVFHSALPSPGQACVLGQPQSSVHRVAARTSGPTASPLAALEMMVVLRQKPLDNNLVLRFPASGPAHRRLPGRDVDDDLFLVRSFQGLWLLTAHSVQLGWFWGSGLVFWSIKYVFSGNEVN